MKVILLKDVKSLGMEGDVVEVSEGYARNFLFPQHLAVEATDETVRAKAEKEKSTKRKVKKAEKEERKAAAALDGAEVIITAKADGGTLYGAIGPKEIASELKKQKHKVDPKWISFESTKEVGSSEATVSFPSGFDATVNVVIEAKE